MDGVSFNPPMELPLGFSENVASPEEAFRKIAQGWLEVSGPITDRKLAVSLGLPLNKIEAALIALESAGVAMRGEFTTEGRANGGVGWGYRVLLAPIHRLPF